MKKSCITSGLSHIINLLDDPYCDLGATGVENFFSDFISCSLSAYVFTRLGTFSVGFFIGSRFEPGKLYQCRLSLNVLLGD